MRRRVEERSRSLIQVAGRDVPAQGTDIVVAVSGKLHHRGELRYVDFDIDADVTEHRLNDLRHVDHRLLVRDDDLKGEAVGVACFGQKLFCFLRLVLIALYVGFREIKKCRIQRRSLDKRYK